jgi:hypothetical protein
MGTISETISYTGKKGEATSFWGRLVALATSNETLSYYLYECRLTKRNENDFLPRTRDFELKIITDLAQLDELTSRGYDLSLDAGFTRRGLQNGAAAFLLFVKGELATRELVATNARAKAAIDKYPYRVDFANREACASGVWTNPKFRQMGLHTYVFFKAYDYLRESGIKVVRSIVWVDNVAAQKAHERFAPDIRKYARGNYLKVMGLHFSWETPLKQTA